MQELPVFVVILTSTIHRRFDHNKSYFDFKGELFSKKKTMRKKQTKPNKEKIGIYHKDVNECLRICKYARHRHRKYQLFIISYIKTTNVF